MRTSPEASAAAVIEGELPSASVTKQVRSAASREGSSVLEVNALDVGVLGAIEPQLPAAVRGPGGGAGDLEVCAGHHAGLGVVDFAGGFGSGERPQVSVVADGPSAGDGAVAVGERGRGRAEPDLIGPG